MLPLNVFAAADPPLAGADVGDAVHAEHTVETDSDAAEQSPWGLADAGGPPVEDVVRQQNSGDRLAEYTAVCAALEFDLDRRRRLGPDRVLRWRDGARAHAAFWRWGTSVERFSANGVGSNGATDRVSWASRMSAETTDRPIPAPSWPVT